jgi:uncharacterized protein
MNGAERMIAPWRRKLRDSRLLLAFDLFAVAAIFLADQFHLIAWSKTPYLLALGWMSMALRGVRWRDVGLRITPRWRRLILIGIVAGCAMEALELFVTQPWLASLTGKNPDLSDFRELIGNWKLLLLLVGLAWVGGGLGEELVWRGYVLNRVTDLFGKTAWGWTMSLALMAIAFGFAHSYQDVTGIAENVIDGVLLGLLYLASGRNLLAPIIAHGMTDTIDFVLIFSGQYPGMR